MYVSSSVLGWHVKILDFNPQQIKKRGEEEVGERRREVETGGERGRREWEIWEGEEGQDEGRNGEGRVKTK